MRHPSIWGSCLLSRYKFRSLARSKFETRIPRTPRIETLRSHPRSTCEQSATLERPLASSSLQNLEYPLIAPRMVDSGPHTSAHTSHAHNFRPSSASDATRSKASNASGYMPQCYFKNSRLPHFAQDRRTFDLQGTSPPTTLTFVKPWCFRFNLARRP